MYQGIIAIGICINTETQAPIY